MDEEKNIAVKTTVDKLRRLYEDYYLSQIFTKKGDYEITALSEILKADTSALTTQKIDHDIFFRELYALNVELFGLAWFKYNYELQEEGKQHSSLCDVALVSEIMFAKSFLEHTNDRDIWSAAGFYNDNIVQATIAQRSSINWARFRDLPSYYGDYGECINSYPDDTLLKTFIEHFNKLLCDKECVSRLANRIISVHALDEGIMIPQKLSSAFAQRLNFNPNIEALLLIQRLNVGIYNNARNFIKAVMDYGSWELARKETDNFVKHIMGVAKTEIEKNSKTKK